MSSTYATAASQCLRPEPQLDRFNKVAQDTVELIDSICDAMEKPRPKLDCHYRVAESMTEQESTP